MSNTSSLSLLLSPEKLYHLCCPWLMQLLERIYYLFFSLSLGYFCLRGASVFLYQPLINYLSNSPLWFSCHYSFNKSSCFSTIALVCLFLKNRHMRLLSHLLLAQAFFIHMLVDLFIHGAMGFKSISPP